MASLKYYNKTTNQWEYVSSNSGSSDILIDNTLTQAGQAADAKAVGEALNGKLSSSELPTAINTALAQAKASGEFDGADGYTPQKNVDYFDGKDGYTPQKGKDYFDGDDYVLTPADKEEIAELAAELVEVPEGSGGGIAVTGATVGQTVKISAVDGNGVPTAWEPVDFPSGGGVIGSGGEWELIGEVTSDGTGDANGISIPCDLNEYKQIYVCGYNLTANTKLRIVMRTALAWYNYSAFFGYNGLGTDQSCYVIKTETSGKMNNIWTLCGFAFNVDGRIFAYGSAEAKSNAGAVPLRQGVQDGALPGEKWNNVKYISLDTNSNNGVVPEGCSLAVWGCK